MTLHLCSCGFGTDDAGWFDSHRAQHPGHYRRGPAPPWPGEPGPPGPGCPPAVSGLTTGELERARRELAASLALARPGSPARVPILAHLSAIDAELAGGRPAATARHRQHDRLTAELARIATAQAGLLTELERLGADTSPATQAYRERIRSVVV